MLILTDKRNGPCMEYAVFGAYILTHEVFERLKVSD